MNTSTEQTMTKAEEITIAMIDVRAQALSKERGSLQSLLTAMQDELEATKRRYMTRIKTAACRAADAESSLRNAIELAPQLFEKPRTFTLHGIKVGLRSSDGKIAFDNSETVIKLIRKFFPDKADVLIISKEEPSKHGLKTLEEKDLPKIGCRIADRGDQVVCSPVDDEIDKLLSKLINDMVETALEPEAA